MNLMVFNYLPIKSHLKLRSLYMSYTNSFLIGTASNVAVAKR